MSVSGISSGNNAAAQYQSRNPQGPVNKDFRQLVHAIKSGDLAVAQSADSTLTDLLQSSPPTNSSSSRSINSLANIQQFLQDVSADLSSNDIAAAQQTLSDFEAKVKGAHHHHDASTTTDTGGSTATSATTSSATTGIDLTV